MSILGSNKVRLAILIAIGLISIVITIVRMPVNRYFANGEKIEASSFGVSIYRGTDNPLFTITPLNDYYYNGSAKEHLENKLTESNNGSVVSEAIQNFNNLLFGKEKLTWNTQGENSKGESSVNYTVEYKGGAIKITRTVKLGTIEPTAIGQVLNICSDCIVTDDKNRAYFNGDTVTNYEIGVAQRANKIPVIVGEQQSFPEGVSKLIIIGGDGKVKMSIPVSKGDLVYVQDKWHILEIKVPTIRGETETVTQTIYLGK